MAYTRSAIVTGGTINLGYYAALEIAKQHADWLVVLCSRSDRENAADRINKTLKQKNTIFLPLDLSDSKKVRAFAQDWSTKNYPPIQALVLNAALQFPDKMVTTDEGIEATFAIAHVGHALLFHLLSPNLAPNARIVPVASGVHDPAMTSGMPPPIYTTAADLAHPPPAIANGPGRRHYCNAKLANILWTYALHRRLSQRAPERSIAVNAFDPGLMPGSGLAREYPAPVRFLWNHVLGPVTPALRVLHHNIHRPRESGASLARLVLSDELAGVSGKYFEGRKEIKSSVDSYDVEKQDDLWRWTVNYCAEDETQAARFESLQG